MTGSFRGPSQRFATSSNRTIAGAEAITRGLAISGTTHEDLTPEQRAARLRQVIDVFGPASGSAVSRVVERSCNERHAARPAGQDPAAQLPLFPPYKI